MPALNIFQQPHHLAMKLIISWVASRGEYGKGAIGLMYIDVRRAYFQAMARRDVFVNLPDEDWEEGMCGKLIKSIYGTRDAAHNWEEEYSGLWRKMDLKERSDHHVYFTMRKSR